MAEPGSLRIRQVYCCGVPIACVSCTEPYTTTAIGRLNAGKTVPTPSFRAIYTFERVFVDQNNETTIT